MREVGVRELRSDLAAAVRRAAAGETTAVTVSGRVAAVLAPAAARTTGVDLLVAGGALVPPRRADRAVPDRPVPVWGYVRLDRLLREIRG